MLAPVVRWFCFAILFCGVVNAQPDELPETIGFNEHIRPIMSNTCFACHGPDESTNDSGLRLDSYEASVGTAEEPGAIVPGDPNASVVIQRIMDEDDPMPPEDFRHQLTSREKLLMRKWIEQGAKFEEHWSYAPIEQPLVPKLSKHASVVANPIDSFVLQKLESIGVEPSPPADKATLLRRLSLDLIGLPPTTEELNQFLADASSGAFERQVDRLLGSPHYGERMAIRWLDIVRFSDTVGFHGDQNQHIFPYRDYVIDSINDNQPFDQFTIEQLAGDLMREPTERQLIASGLVRLNMMTREGGAQPEEYLAKYTADRVRMIGTTWLGSTMGCCECHDHKYDPFSIKDFYAMGAFFDDVLQWGVYNDYGYTPNPDLRGYNNNSPFPPELRVKSPSLMKQIEFLEDQLDIAASIHVSQKEFESSKFKNWLAGVMSEYMNAPTLWAQVRPNRVSLAKDEKFEQLDDESLLFSGRPKQGQSIRVATRFDKPTLVKSFKLQVLPDPKNKGFVGRSQGMFSTGISLTHRKKPTPGEERVEIRPRFVRIELPGRSKILSLAEVQVFGPDGDRNLAAGGKAKQSSVAYNGLAKLAIDGSTDGDHSKQPGVTHSETENDPWWELDLLDQKQIDRIVIWNRTDGNLQSRLNGFRVLLLDEDRKLVFQSSPKLPMSSVELNVPESIDVVDLILPESVAYGQANRYVPDRYSNGQANAYLGKVWRSGPAKWHLPSDESKLPHQAVFHLETAITVNPNDELVFTIDSKDIGKFKLFVSGIARPVVGELAGRRKLMSSLSKLTNVSLGKGNDLNGSLLNGNLLDKNDNRVLKSAYYRSVTPASGQESSVRKLRNDIADCYSGNTLTMVSQPTAESKRRVSRVLARGDWKDKSGERVDPNTPHFLPAIESDKRRRNRLDLANWIVSTSNPLTARHYVNRTWRHFFGNGLSAVLDDLGNQGQWPSHPRLLDWLASEFRKDWDRKRITKLIVMSSTYRQAAALRPELHERDPGNRWLAQQSPRRLEAELVRDNALAISGLLNTTWIGGRSVFPYQPPGYYANIQFPNRKYATQTNGLQYRRGLYMHWQRTFLHPMLTNFDAPSRDECTADRTESNSPQQALTLLNDPVFVEAARAFAMRLLSGQTEHEIETLVEKAFQIALARKPEQLETESLTRLYRQQLNFYRQDREEAAAFSKPGRAGLSAAVDEDEVVDVAELASLAQVCRVILNLHEVITRY